MLLQGRNAVKTLDLPKPANNDPRPFEVLGIPLEPGFHVLEIASQRLGDALLDARLGKQRTMYVRSSALVTNLGVHFKLGNARSGLKPLAVLLERWVRHLLGVEVQITPDGSPAGNPAFDVTPARLVTALITEHGACAASASAIRALLGATA